MLSIFLLVDCTNQARASGTTAKPSGLGIRILSGIEHILLMLSMMPFQANTTSTLLATYVYCDYFGCDPSSRVSCETEDSFDDGDVEVDYCETARRQKGPRTKV